MSTITATRAAVLGPLRDWLRTVTAVATLTGTDATLAKESIYAGGLGSGHVMPAVVLTKVGMSSVPGVTESHLIQADCWASKAQGEAQAEALAAAVKTAFEQVTPGTQLGSSTVRLLGASIEAEVALPDPDDGTHRYVVTALVTTKVVA